MKIKGKKTHEDDNKIGISIASTHQKSKMKRKFCWKPVERKNDKPKMRKLKTKTRKYSKHSKRLSQTFPPLTSCLVRHVKSMHIHNTAHSMRQLALMPLLLWALMLLHLYGSPPVCTMAMAKAKAKTVFHHLIYCYYCTRTKPLWKFQFIIWKRGVACMNSLFILLCLLLLLPTDVCTLDWVSECVWHF